MYSFDHISKADQVTRIPSGEAQCGHSHRTNSYYSYREPDNRPAAVDVWFDKGYKALIFSCKRHTGSIKSAVTRGTYAGRDIVDPRDFGIDLGEAVGNPEATIKRLLKAIADEETARSRRSDIAMRVHLAEQWEKKREEYAAQDDITFRPFETDDYGRTFVQVVIGKSYGSTVVKLTPSQVRRLVEHAPLWADNAERLTLDAKPPTVTDEERAFLNVRDEE